MNRPLVASLCALCVCACLASGVSAVTHTWNGGNTFGPNSMSNSLNWSGGVPVSGSPNLTLIFPNSPSSPTPNQNIANPLVLQELQLGGFYTFSGSPLRFENLGAAPSITQSSVVSLSNDITFVDPTTITTANGNFNLSGALSGSVTFASSTTPGFPNYISLGGSSSNSLAATVTNYTLLEVNKPSAISSSLVLNGGNALLNAANALAPGTNVTVNAPVISSSFATLRMDQNNTINALTLNGGSVGAASSTLTLTGPVNSTGQSAIIGASSSMTQPFLDLNGGIVVFNVAAPASPGDQLSVQIPVGNGSITKTGAGVLDLQNTSTFTGQTVVTAGTLRGYSTTIGNNVLNNSVVNLTGGTYTGAISGSGSVILDGFQTFASLNSYTGGTSMSPGASLIAEPQYLHGTVTGSGIGNQVFITAPTNQTLNATLAGGMDISKGGSGVMTLSTAGTQTGPFYLSDGGLRFTVSNALGASTLTFNNPGQTTSLEAVGTITLPNQTSFGGPVQVLGSGNLQLTSTASKNTNFAVTHSSTGSTVVDGKFTLGASGSVTVNSGQLTLGDPAAVGGFVAAGPIAVNGGGTLTLRSVNFISLPDVTLAGGTLNTLNGYAIPLGAALQGTGAVTGRVASANGSSIIATGGLTLGDAAHAAGVNLDGELYTNNNTVTLDDSNQAVLGSLTDIGTATMDGTLVSSNGLVLNFGRNLVGRGQVQSNNTLADAVIVNGDVNGDALATPLVFTGYVKGVGTFNNVAFAGTFAPGLSPTLLTVGNTLLLPTNVLDMEIGGLNRGSQYDAFDVTPASTMQFDGTLKVTLFNAFSPSLGDQFDLFNGTTTSVFSNFMFPALNPGLAWDTSLLYTQGILQVVTNIPEPAAASLALLACALLVRRRRN